jgi:large subunit ribosomal protein L29
VTNQEQSEVSLKKQREDLRKVDTDQIKQKILDAKQELFNLRFMLVTGSSTDNSQVRRVKRNIARMNTIVREKEVSQSNGQK